MSRETKIVCQWSEVRDVSTQSQSPGSPILSHDFKTSNNQRLQSAGDKDQRSNAFAPTQ